MSIAELLALADIVKNETGISRNNAVRIGMALEEIIKYFRDNAGSGGESGSADGGVLESISAMNFAPQGKFYGVQLAENHPELGIDHFSLICMRGGSQEELVQVAIGYDGTAQKLWLRGGEINSYGLFNQISGGGGTVDEVDPVFAAWKDASFIGGRLKPSLLPQEIEEMSPIEFEATDVINGIIIPESPTKLYRISTATDLTVSINTALLDLTKYIKLFVKVNINDWCTITWPSNFYFANLNYPVQVGEYMYEVSSSDGGETWRASQKYKNVASVKLDQEGNEIIGAKTLFVDGEKADNSGDGLTWLTAKKDVQAAIDISTIGDAVFVKGKLGGLKYLPTMERTPGTARSKSFIMKSGVHLYGGFKGIETTLYEREMVSYLQIMRLPTGTYNMYVDLPKYRSILSGEIAGDSVKETVTAGSQFTNASIANNSYVVVFGDVAGNTAFNGFDVIGAFNDQSYDGGGIYGSQGLKVSNCEVYNNRRYSSINTVYGGVGIYNATVNNTIIRNNDSGKVAMYQSAGTGCLYCTISNSIIHSHVVRGYYGSGGQGTVSGSSILNSAVFNNIAPDASSIGINTSGICFSTAINSVSYNNTSISVYGAGFHTCTATNCSAYNNSKAVNSTVGAGFVSSTCINCTAYNNTAPLGAGFHTCSTCVNCAAYNNTVKDNGGGFLSCTCINCVSIRNKAATGGGSFNSILRNTVVYGNKNSVGNKSNVYNDNASEETYSAFEDEIRAGTGNISLSVNNTGDANSPYFQSLSTESGVVDELYVSNPNINTDSALKNSGLDSLNTHSYGGLYDLVSNPRKVNTIDIGAYEIQ